MASMDESHDPGDVLPAIIRKRRYRREMGDSSTEESRDEVLSILQSRKVSPGMTMLLDMMIEGYAKLEEMGPNSENHCRQQLEIMRQEEIVQSRLQKDQSHCKLTLEFRKLLAKNVIIRYGDYNKTNVSILKSKCLELARERKIETDFLASMTWRQVLQSLTTEKEK